MIAKINKKIWIIFFVVTFSVAALYFYFFSLHEIKRFNLSTPLFWKNGLIKRISLGPYQFDFDSERKYFRIFHAGKPILSSGGGTFIFASTEKAVIKENHGSFSVTSVNGHNCSSQSIESIEKKSNAVEISGHLNCPVGEKHWRLIFTDNPKGDLDFSLVASNDLHRIMLRLASDEDESVYGAGEQYTHFNLKNSRIPILVREQGIGRGLQPLTAIMNTIADSGGDEFSTYYSAPVFLTSKYRALILKNKGFGFLDFTENGIGMDYFSSEIHGTLIDAGGPKELVTELTSYTGKMHPLPDWVLKGAVLGIQGGTEKVSKILADFIDGGAPIAALWLQDWVGQRKTAIGKQLWWSWSLDRGHYPGWEQFLKSLSRKGIRVLGYINPFLVNFPDQKNNRRNLWREAEEKKYFVLSKAGNPLNLKNTSFSANLIDLTNPQARGWLASVIRTEMIDIGFSGWMADFGEGLPFNASLFSGDPNEVHNTYPELWAAVNRKAVDGTAKPNDFVFFMRSGYTHSPAYNSLFWAGDQLVTWDSYDGMKSALNAMLSSGLIGASMNHSDIGGYTGFKLPFFSYLRSEELLDRWMELNVFSAVFRSHEGNQPENNLQIYSNERLRAQFTSMAKLFAELYPYRKKAMREAVDYGWPMIRPMWFEFPEEAAMKNNHSQFMFGDQILVAPVLDPGKRM